MKDVTVVLFDIDGTLLDTGGAGRTAMEAAFAEFCGRGDVCAHFSFDGMTDRAIVREGLRVAGDVVDEARIDRLIDSYLRHLEHVLPRHTHRVMPGVHALLDVLQARTDVAVGLGTGNVRVGAYAKLRVASLDTAFAFGGFGSDAEERAALLRAGAERGAAHAGVALAQCRVVVIGDTPKDVEAARAIGAESIAVTTGRYDRAALSATGADRVVADLTGLDL